MEIKWILPENKLPENEEKVLITMRSGTEIPGLGRSTDMTVYVAMFYTNGVMDNEWYPFFYLPSYNVKLVQEVIAWAPLPKPFKLNSTPE